MKRIIILGASGQLGSILFQELSRIDEYNVIGTSRSRKTGVLQFDPFVDNWDVLGKVDVLINCVGIIKEKKDSSYYKVHYELARLIISNRDLIGMPRIIQISALGASSHHKVTFLQTKGQADALLLSLSDTLVMRPSIVCTPDTMLAKKLTVLKKFSKCLFGFLLLPQGFPEHKVQPVMPLDLAEAVKRTVEAETVINTRILNIVGPNALSYEELIDIQLPSKIKILEIPRWTADLLVSCFMAPLFPTFINREQYSLLFSDNIANASDTESHLGRRPVSTLDFWIGNSIKTNNYSAYKT